MLFSQTVHKVHNILSNLFSIFSNFFNSFIIFLSNILEIFILTLIIVCNFFIIFDFLAQTYVKFFKIADHLFRYGISKNYLNVPHLFSRTDVFLLFIIFLTFLTSLLMTICKRIKKAIVTFALATILLILFIEEYYSKHNFSSLIILKKIAKLLINNPHISPHQQRPKSLQQHQKTFKQITLNHQHTSLFKTIHIHLKDDTHDCPNH